MHRATIEGLHGLPPRKPGPWLTPFVLVLACAGLAACARVTHRPVPTAQADARMDGIRYLGTSLYWLVHSDGKGGIDSQFQWLPDQSKMMVATPKSFVAKLDLDMTFEDGVLTSATETADSTTIPSAVVAAASTLIPELRARAAADAVRMRQEGALTGNEHAVPAPYLFKVVVRGDAVEFIGDDRPGPIRVTLIPEEKKGKK